MSATRERSRNLIVDGPQTIKYLIFVGVCRTFPLLFLLLCESNLLFQQQKESLWVSVLLPTYSKSSFKSPTSFFFSIKKTAAIVDKLIAANGEITRPSPCCCHCSSNVICFAVKKNPFSSSLISRMAVTSHRVLMCACVCKVATKFTLYLLSTDGFQGTCHGGCFSDSSQTEESAVIVFD